MKITGKRIVVTGGAGFIGSHLSDRLISSGYNVTILDNLSTGAEENIPKEALFERLDISDEEKVNGFFKNHASSIDAIVHLAAYVNLAESMKVPAIDAKTNIMGTLNLISAAMENGIRKIVFSSSAATYGIPDPEKLPIDEQHPQIPSSPYGISKYMDELYLNLYGADLNPVIFRFGNIYGPRQNRAGKGEGGIVSKLFSRIKNRCDDVELRGFGEPIRDYIFVGDIVDALIMGLTAKPGTYNLGTNHGTSVNEVWSLIQDACKSKTDKLPLARLVPLLPGEIEKMILSYDKARKELGWEPRVAFRDGINATADYFFASQ